MKCRRCQIAQTQQGAAQTAITQVPVSNFLPAAPPPFSLRDCCCCLMTRQSKEIRIVFSFSFSFLLFSIFLFPPSLWPCATGWLDDASWWPQPLFPSELRFPHTHLLSVAAVQLHCGPLCCVFLSSLHVCVCVFVWALALFADSFKAETELAQIKKKCCAQ